MQSRLAGELCEQGRAADEANRQGDFEQARASYETLLQGLDAEADALQAYLAAKAALGLLLAEVRAGHLARARSLWERRTGSPALRHGLGLLEQGHASPPDQALYLLLSAYLTSLEAPDKELASREVCALMTRALALAEPTLRPRLALNWRCHLEQIFQGPVPARWLKQIEPPPLAGDSLAFPHPDAWHVRGLPHRPTLQGDLPLWPPRVEAPPPWTPQSRWWPGLWIGIGTLATPVQLGQVSPQTLGIGVLAGCVISVPGWLLDYALRRRWWAGVAGGVLATLITPVAIRLPGWAMAPALLWWSSAGAGLEIAIRMLLEALDRSPRLPEILVSMGRGHWAEAQARLDQALARHPKDWRLLANRAVCHAVMNQPERAESDFEEACQALGPSGPARLQAVHGYLLWREAREGSRDALERALRELQGEDVEGYRMRAACHVLDQNWEAAQRELDAGLERHPEAAGLRLERARLHLTQGRPDAAVADLLSVAEHSNQEGALREAREALLRIGAESEDPASGPAPDPEIHVAADGQFSVWLPTRPQAVAEGVYLAHGRVHYLVERTQADGGPLRLPERAGLRGELTWESKLDSLGEIHSLEVLGESVSPEPLRGYSRVLSSGGDELLSRQVTVPEGHPQAGQVYQLSVWGPQGELTQAFQFLGSFAPGAQARRPAWLFVPGEPMPGKTVAIERGEDTLYGVQGSLPWIGRPELALTLEARPRILEVDSLDGLSRSADLSLEPYHRFVAYQHLGPANSLGIRPYQLLAEADAPALAQALLHSRAESLLLLTAGIQPGALRSLADRLEGRTLITLGLAWTFASADLTDDASLCEEIAYTVRLLRCRRLSLLSAALDNACRKLLRAGLDSCSELEACRIFARSDEGGYLEHEF